MSIALGVWCISSIALHAVLQPCMLKSTKGQPASQYIVLLQEKPSLWSSTSYLQNNTRHQLDHIECVCCRHLAAGNNRDRKGESCSEEHLILLACGASLALLCMQFCNPVCLNQQKGLSRLYCLETAQFISRHMMCRAINASVSHMLLLALNFNITWDANALQQP